MKDLVMDYAALVENQKTAPKEMINSPYSISVCIFLLLEKNNCFSNRLSIEFFAVSRANISCLP